MTSDRKTRIGSYVLMFFIVISIVISLGSYWALNHWNAEPTSESCVSKVERFYFPESDHKETIIFYCIDGYTYLGKQNSNGFVPQFLGNHISYPHRCSCQDKSHGQ